MVIDNSVNIEKKLDEICIVLKDIKNFIAMQIQQTQQTQQILNKLNKIGEK